MKPKNREEWLACRDEIVEAMAGLRRLGEYGCGNGNCLIHRPTGLHTNGSCKCYKRIAEDALRLAELADEIKNIVSFPV